MRSSVPLSAAFAAVSLVAGAASAEAEDMRTFLYGNFLCAEAEPIPTVTRTQERYFHEIRDVRKASHQVCANVTGFSILSQLPVERRVPAPTKRECDTYDLIAYTLMCRGGSVSAARFFMATDRDKRLNDSRGPFKLEGDTLLAPFYGSYSRPPDAYAALPAGYGFEPGVDYTQRQITLPWDKISTGAAITTTGSISTAIPAPLPASAWVRFLKTAWPWPQLLIAACLTAYAAFAFVGLTVRDNGDPVPRLRLILVLAIALVPLRFTRNPATMPDAAVAQARAAISAAHGRVDEAERDRAVLRQLIHFTPGTTALEPFSEADLKRVQALIGTRSVTVTPQPHSNPSVLATILLLPSLLLLVYLPAFLRGRHYLFVAHPVGSVVAPPLRSGELFPARKLGQALRPNPAQLHEHPPAYQSRNLLEKARALKERISADADIADAAMRRDRARAQQMQAEAELREARKKLPWWKRLFVR